MNIKKILSIFFIFLFCSSGFADIDSILKKGYLTVGLYHYDSYPFFFHGENNRLEGFDIDISRKIAKNLGVKVVFNRDADTFNKLTDLVVNRKVDIVVSWFSRTLERAKKIRFTKPYFVDNQCLLINRLKAARLFKTTDYLKLLNRKDIQVGTVYGTSYVSFIKKILPFCKQRLYKTWKKCYEDVLKGKIVAGLWSEVEISNLLNLHPEHGIKVKMVKLPLKDYIAVGINAKDRQLCYWLNIFFTIENYNFTPKTLIERYRK